MTNKAEESQRGVSVRNMNVIMAAVMLLISISLLTATWRANAGYSNLRTNTDNYIRWQRDAYDLQMGSDYLTEQVRCYAVTGDRQYLDNYFNEADVTRRRDRAVESVHDFIGETGAYEVLTAAMKESVALMDREYYAMRLMIAALGEDLASYPEPVQQTALSEADAALDPEAQKTLARTMVFDDIYREKKDAISQNMQACLAALADEIETQQFTTADKLDRMLSRQRLLIILSITITTITMICSLALVIGPLLRAVTLIRGGQPIPVEGSREFRFLAKTYNQMYEANMQQKEELAYEATHDNLTGVYNRNGYDAIQRNVNWDTSVLVLFDVDRFKPINDTYGHKMGDRVLAYVAKTIQDSFRAQDYVCRIGGDEFAVIMVHASSDISELIRQKVDRINDALAAPDEDIPVVHISCGAACGANFDNFDRLFHDVDAALYRVKNSGGRGCEFVK